MTQSVCARYLLLPAVALGLHTLTAQAGDPVDEAPEVSVEERYELGFVLLERGGSAVPELLERMAAGDKFAAEIFERQINVTDPAAGVVPALRAALGHDNAKLRACAAYGAGGLERSGPWSELLSALASRAAEDKSTAVRLQALHALARGEKRSRTPAVYAALLSALSDSSARIVRSAAAAAARIGADGAASDQVERKLEALAATLSGEDGRLLKQARRAFVGVGPLPPLPGCPHPLGLDVGTKVATAFVDRTQRRNLRAHGGNSLTHDAMTRALAWLVRRQEDNGKWGSAADSSLAMLALLGDGYTDRLGENRFRDNRLRRDAARALRRGLHALLHSNQDDPRAVQVLCEAYALTGDAMYGKAAREGVSALLRRQKPTVWDADALATARGAGLSVPDEALTRATANGVAANAWIRQLCDRKPELQRVMNRLPAWDSRTDLEHIYFGSKVAFRAGGRDWNTWNRSLKQQILANQRTKGDARFDGSWDPVDGRSRTATTALMARTLAVYYADVR